MMLLTFIGQSVATVNPSCSMSDNSGEMPMSSMDGMDHSAHAMHGLADIDQSASDCCEDVTCPMSSCIGSLSMSATTGMQDSMPYASVLNAEYTVSYLTPSLHSLFRPPISR